MTPPTYFALGPYASGAGGMTKLATLLNYYNKPNDPEWTFAPYAASQDTGAGSLKGMGFPTATAHWDGLYAVQREALRTICPGLSAHVFVNAWVNETASQVLVWHTFDEQMLWMTKEEGKESNLIELAVDVKFRTMIQVA